MVHRPVHMHPFRLPDSLALLGPDSGEVVHCGKVVLRHPEDAGVPGQGETQPNSPHLRVPRGSHRRPRKRHLLRLPEGTAPLPGPVAASQGPDPETMG